MSIQDEYEHITLSAIQSIQNKKKMDKKCPYNALKTEIKNMIMKGIEKTLENLVEDGKIKQGDTMNDFYYEIKEK